MLKVRRGLDADRQTVIFADGEPVWTTDLQQAWVGDGVTLGGILIGGSGAGVQSVTGLDTDNTDPQNPIVQISVDGVTVTGDGTPGNPLVATATTPSLTASEVAYGDASNLITSDAGFTRDPVTLDTTISVGNVGLALGVQSGGEAIIFEAGDAVQFETLFALGDLTSAGLPTFQAMLRVEDYISNFINLLKVKEDSTINEITDGTATSSIHNTLAHVHISFTDGVDLYEVGVDGTGIFLTSVPLSASSDDKMVVWDSVTGYVGYRALPQVAYAILSTLGVLANAAGVLTNDGAGVLSWVAAATTLYSGDGTLASDRTVTLNSKFLKVANASGNLLEIDPVGLYTGIQAYNGSRVATLDLYSGASGDTITKFRLYAYKTTDVQIEGDAVAQTLDFRATNGLTVTTGLSSSASVNDTMVVFDTSTKKLNYRAIPTGSDYTNSFLFMGG